MIFRQLFEPESSTYTYLLACPETRAAILVDPVIETLERDLAMLQALELRLSHTLETHIHADHVTSAARLRALTGCKVAIPALDGVAGADVAVSEAAPLAIGTVALQPLFTPGHTDNHHSYFVAAGGAPRVLTGDALLIGGCGRTDFQCGDAATLYRSVHDKLFALPGETRVYPAHDYKGRRSSSIGAERARNPRLGGKRTIEDFVAIMAGLGLPPPKKMAVAVPANRRCGEMEPAEGP